jgi:branched-chain amino acid transport system permease protein
MQGGLDSVSRRSSKSKLVIIGVMTMLVVMLPLIASHQVVYLLVLGLFGAVLALGLNIFFGYCGQINFGVAGFFALGAYGVALMEKYFHFHFLINLSVAFVITGLITWIISLCLLRLRHHTLALGTLSFSLAVYTAVSQGFTNVTGGEDGINLDSLFVFGVKVGDVFYYYLLVFITGVCYLVNINLRNSRLGRAMVGIGQNETMARALGIDVNSVLLLGLLFNGLMAGIAGGLYVKWTGWASPEYFGMMCNVIVVVAAVLGGTGSAAGAIIGGVFMFMLPQLLISFATYQLLVYGAILGALILFMPSGIMGVIHSVALKLKADMRNE